jgi:putative phage-type endonuclease
METNKLDWLAKRSKGIGGSDAAAICGVSPYKTPLMVWEEKRGLLKEQQDNDAMFWGRTLEPIVRQRYSDVTGQDVLLPTEILKSEQYPFMLANIDGLTREPKGVEIKTAGYPTGWGEPGTDEVPIGYIFQCAHYSIITAIPVWDIPVLIGGRDFRIYTVEPDRELKELIIEKEAEFWQMVQDGTPPNPVNYEDVIRLYRKSEAKQVTATEDVEFWTEALRKVRSELKTLEQNEQEAKRRIMEFMADADTLLNIEGQTICTWKTGKPAKRFDVKTLQKLQPETYSQFLVEGEPTRRFLLKGEI